MHDRPATQRLAAGWIGMSSAGAKAVAPRTSTSLPNTHSAESRLTFVADRFRRRRRGIRLECSAWKAPETALLERSSSCKKYLAGPSHAISDLLPLCSLKLASRTIRVSIKAGNAMILGNVAVGSQSRSSSVFMAGRPGCTHRISLVSILSAFTGRTKLTAVGPLAWSTTSPHVTGGSRQTGGNCSVVRSTCSPKAARNNLSGASLKRTGGLSESLALFLAGSTAAPVGCSARSGPASGSTAPTKPVLPSSSAG
mmetsp:Transcript_42579/g.118583  ORF Transcript_42579/g.118583 Transcript_42579/m.118583 type:complete len:254 (+) Transcript_42579:951-1712(+)